MQKREQVPIRTPTYLLQFGEKTASVKICSVRGCILGAPAAAHLRTALSKTYPSNKHHRPVHTVVHQTHDTETRRAVITTISSRSENEQIDSTVLFFSKNKYSKEIVQTLNMVPWQGASYLSQGPQQPLNLPMPLHIR